MYSWVTHRGYTRRRVAAISFLHGAPPSSCSAPASAAWSSSRLVSELGDAVDVTLIDRSDAFVFGFALDMTFGRRMLELRSAANAAIGNAVRFRRCRP